MGFLQGCEKGLNDLKTDCQKGLHDLASFFNKAAVRDRVQGLALGAATAFTFTGLNWICAGVGAGIGLVMGRRKLMTVFNTVGKYFGLKVMTDAVIEAGEKICPPKPDLAPAVQPEPPEVKDEPKMFKDLWVTFGKTASKDLPAPWKIMHLPPAATFIPPPAPGGGMAFA